MVKPKPELIELLVRWHLSETESLGNLVGGGGHLGYRSLSQLIIKDITESGEGYGVSFDYSIQTDSEFTIFPDNPPPEVHKSGSIHITEQLIARYESSKKVSDDQRATDDQRFLDSFLD